MKGKKLAFIDIETTGTNPFKHEILEIGCLIARQNDDGTFEAVEEFEVKVQPEHIETAEPEALRINGYDESQWLFAHTLEESLKLLNQKLGGSATMIAHNITFDYSFIINAYSRLGMEDPFFHKYDTLTMALMKFKDEEDMQRLSLRALCERFNIKNDKAHTALADVRATFEVFKKLMAK